MYLKFQKSTFALSVRKYNFFGTKGKKKKNRYKMNTKKIVQNTVRSLF